MSRNLEYGDTGDDVRELQETLSSLGYHEVGRADGGFYQHTQAAVHRFQSDHGLPATGRVDEHTMSTLSQAKAAAMQHAVQQGQHGHTSPTEDPNAPWHRRDVPADGYTRVWFDHENFMDYSDADFGQLYVDYATGFQLQLDPWAPQNVDQQTIHLHYAGGQVYSVVLGHIGTGNPTDRYLMDSSGVVLPCDHSLAVSFTRSHVPHLYLLRESIHAAVARLIEERLEIAYIVAAFADIIGLNSSGGDPGVYDRVHEKARAAAELEGHH
jgi:Putative peptidoglycan binding domain